MMDKHFHWNGQEFHPDCEEMVCPVYDTYKDFTLDASGHYVLIRINFEYLHIEVAICNPDNQIIKVFKGAKAQDVYHTIFTYEKDHKLTWFTDPEHMAYLGKELKKAELALVLGGSYYQE